MTKERIQYRKPTTNSDVVKLDQKFFSVCTILVFINVNWHHSRRLNENLSGIRVYSPHEYLRGAKFIEANYLDIRNSEE